MDGTKPAHRAVTAKPRLGGWVGFDSEHRRQERDVVCSSTQGRELDREELEERCPARRPECGVHGRGSGNTEEM
jgi:hypothetical protein